MNISNTDVIHDKDLLILAQLSRYTGNSFHNPY